MSVTVVVGNPKPGSRTYQAAHLVARKPTGAQPDLSIDLADLGAARCWAARHPRGVVMRRKGGG